MIHLFGWILFFVALIVCVLLHEAGHFVTAKKFGMKATQFFAGFGPTLWSFRRGETEYGFKAIPAGGFVKIVGMTELEEVDPADEPRAFYRQKPWQKTVVLAAGSFMHFVIALVLIYVVLLVAGLGTGKSSLKVDQVSACVPASATSDGCARNAPAAPAKAAGFLPGDVITALNGTPVASWEEFSATIRSHQPGDRVTVTVRRDGASVDLHPVLAATDRPDPSDPKRTLHHVGFIGIGPAEVIQHFNALDAVPRSGELFGSTVKLTFTHLGDVVSQIPKLFSKDRSATNSPQSIVGVGNMAGDALANSPSVSAAVAAFLSLLIGLNIFIGIFNLLPLLPLDGGHLAILWFERARAMLAHWFGRPDPGRVDLQKVMPLAYAVVVLFIGLTVMLFAADIVNPVASPF